MHLWSIWPFSNPVFLQENGKNSSNGLDLWWQFLQRDLHPGPVQPRGSGHRAAGDGGLHPVQSGQPRFPLPRGPRGWRRSPWQCWVVGPGHGAQMDQRQHHHVWRRSRQNYTIFRQNLHLLRLIYYLNKTQCLQMRLQLRLTNFQDLTQHRLNF